METLSGKRYRAGQSHVETVQLTYTKHGVSFTPDENYAWAQLKFDAVITGLPAAITLPGGDRFEPDDAHFRWPSQASATGFATRFETCVAKLENHPFAAIFAVLAVPALIWLLVTVLIPKVALHSAKVMPDAVITEMGEQAHHFLTLAMLSDSEIKLEQQSQLNTLWQSTLAKLQQSPNGLHPARQYRLYFYASSTLGANALALPNGDVIVTDDLVNKLASQPDALTAILLHEIGHVEQFHSARMAAQSALASLTFALLFGDLESVAELVIGTGSVYVQQQFSQQMEWEADRYALSRLYQLGLSGEALANALSTITQSSELSTTENSSVWQNYLSTHPSTTDRIIVARQYRGE
ncbi:M48 family metallopeptidase [Pseudoalteromonas fenneropenaei]|uniref:M48 family metallopeptidase n=1 Tax=Pseudoalteromonas fenneropenaei TaxID=1737459 RepID=A0ABV7CDJ5_9GAMM